MTELVSGGIDHLNIGVSDARRSRDFYAAALKPLGIDLLMSFPPKNAEPSSDQSESDAWIHGFGRGQNPFFCIVGKAEVGASMHVAFAAGTQAEVDAFYAAAIAAGGKDNGGPGLRPYHPHYYGAFVLDPDGINIEAVCHAPQA